MAKIKKVTSGEGHKAPFRLFGNINHTPRTFTSGEFSAVFSVRPMRADERAKFRAAEDRLRLSQDYAGAYGRAGVTPDMVDAEKHSEEEIFQAYQKIMSHRIVDPEESARFATVSRHVVVACCDYVIFEGVKTMISGDVFDSLPESVQAWLLDEVQAESFITEEEEVGL